MTSQIASSATLANGRDALTSLRTKASKFTADNLPKAATAAEHAGQTIADFAVSSSRSIAKTLRESKSLQSLREQVPEATTKLAETVGAWQSRPLARRAGRFALRNPALVAAAGIAVVAIGYSLWRRREASTSDTQTS